MINLQLKQAIINYIFENYNLFNRLNNTIHNFKNYIYNENWNYLIGWKEIIEWIEKIDKMI